MDEASHSVVVGETPSGALIYQVGAGPEALPPVRGRDLERAWDLARDGAATAAWGQCRLFRFVRSDGESTELALADPDACCWAGALDLAIGLRTRYGVSLFIRLLALIDLLGRARWTGAWFAIRRGEAELHPALLTAAATAPLNADARFDEAPFRANLSALVPLPLASGATA